jgi:hypothetical protein
LKAVDALVKHAVAARNGTASSPDIIAGGTETIAVTPTVSGISAKNAVETISLPATVEYVDGSGKFGGVDNYPTVTVNADGSSELAFALGDLAAGTTDELTFDVNTRADAPMPSKAQVTAVVSWAGSDFVNIAQRTASVSFNIAAPLSTFSVVQSQSVAVLQPKMSQTYTFVSSNTTAAAVTGVTAIDVLPYNGDANGTTGLKGAYKVSGLTAKGGTGTAVFYTTDEAARVNAADAAVAWTVCGTDCALPAGVTAVKWTAAQLDSGALLRVSFKLSDFDADNNAVVANSLTFLDSSYTGVIHNLAVSSAMFKKSSIFGVVYGDMDGSGDFGAGDTKIAGNRVDLLKAGLVVDSVVTDGEGRYRFEDLASGTYDVRAETPANMVSEDDTIEGVVVTAGSEVGSRDIGFEDIGIALALDSDSLRFNLTPNTVATGSDFVRLVTTTNSRNGYRLWISAADNRLVCSAPVAAINSVSGKGVELGNNTWGYHVSDGVPAAWNEVPTTPSQIKSTSAAAKLGDVTKIHFGVKVDLAVPACDYTGGVVLTAVAGI